MTGTGDGRENKRRKWKIGSCLGSVFGGKRKRKICLILFVYKHVNERKNERNK